MEYGKVAYWVLQVAEVCLWYCLLFPEMTDRRTKRGERGRLWAAVLVWGGLYGYNGMEAIVSFYLAITSMLLAGIPFVIFCRNYLLVGSLWAMISTSSAYLIKLAALLGRAILLKKGIVEVNYNSSMWMDCGTEILLIAILLIGGRAIKKQGLRVSELCKKSWPFFLVIGFLECMLLRYIMFTGAYEVSTSMMVLNLCVIVSVISCLIAAVLWYINRKSQEEQRFVQTQNKLLRDQYDAMQEEYQRFSRLTHERNRERQYLYYCLTEGQTEQALNYLNEKEKDAVQNKRVWTKNKFLDFLINVRKEKMDCFFTENKLYSYSD